MDGHRAMSPEVGGVVHWEHVNLRVPDHRAATLYFIEGLGLTRDPMRMVGVRNMWVNVGTQQLHLPLGEPSPFPGEVGLVVPDVAEVARRLSRVAAELGVPEVSGSVEEGTLLSETPWGHRIRVLPAEGDGARCPQRLAYAAFDVPPGHAERIAAFYRDILGCPVVTGPGEGSPAVWVTVGPRQTFRFRERPDGRVVTSANHVAIYVIRHQALHAALDRLGALMGTREDEQFRFDRVVDPRSGALLFRFEHEVRNLHHPDYLRPLINRLPVGYRVD